MFRDAMGHFLSALRLQNSDHNSQIWSKLRSCVIRTSQFLSESSSTWSNKALDAIRFRNIDELIQLNAIK